MTQPVMSPELVEQVVRAYVARMARRYTPVLLLVAAFVLVVTLTPTVPRTNQAAAGSYPGQPTAGGAVGSVPANGAGGAGPAAPGPAAGGSSAAAGSLGTSTSGSTSSPVQAVSADASGVSRSGVHCGHGARQVTWSHYATYCTPAFHGNNGGSTAYGVTAKQITVVARFSRSGESGAVDAAAQGAFPSQAQYMDDLSAYISYFNKAFELYGRQVVLKEFNGQGDWLQEYQGQDAAGAQADAQSAHDLGGFADVSTAIDVSTPMYTQYLAQKGLVAIGGVVASQHFLEQYAPYVYTALPTVTDAANFFGGLICKRMLGLNAVFSGDATLQNTQRVFGMIYPENPDYSAAAALIKKHVQDCGGAIKYTYAYALDVSTLETQDENAIAQFHSDGVSTIICLCDNVSPVFLTTAADHQQYHPEWLALNPGDPYGQDYQQDQWSHALTFGGGTKDPKKTEAYRVYKLANPDKEPAELTRLPVAYAVAMQLFDALQAAGPDLTPATFERGEFAIPDSLAGGDFGPWHFGGNGFAPSVSTQIAWWNANGTSPLDGKAGTYTDCSGADADYKPWRTYDAAAYGPARTQLHCFGK